MSTPSIRILKFGSSVLRTPRDLRAVVHEIYREVRAGHRVVAVVSAFEGVTDRLLARAERVSNGTLASAKAAYVATGETETSALLALALDRAGVAAEVLDAERIGLLAHGDPLDAQLVSVDTSALLAAIASHTVVVVPGFVARDASRRVVLLGRGGSDLTALFLAHALPNATAKLVKDVDGVFELDPAQNTQGNLRYAQISIVDALRVGGAVVQPKALRFALERNLAFEVAALGSDAGTRVAAGSTRLAWPAEPPRALRVALLGLGTVGLGVYRALERRADRFEVRHVLVRSSIGRVHPRVPRELLTHEASTALYRETDVVVELLGGEEPARTLVAGALARGIDVITANKALVALHGRELEAIAARTGATLTYSAAVGGSVPMLETVGRLAGRALAFEGVLNATTNFVLDRVADGATFAEAVARAHELGFCESNPWTDLSGTDTAHKLELLARAAFGDAPIAWGERRGIDGLDEDGVRAALRRGARMRLVGSCRLVDGHVEASFAPREFADASVFGSVRDEWNALDVETLAGEHVVLTGKGAGRWPTTESVLGDLFALARERARESVRAHVTNVVDRAFEEPASDDAIVGSGRSTELRANAVPLHGAPRTHTDVVDLAEAS